MGRDGNFIPQKERMKLMDRGHTPVESYVVTLLITHDTSVAGYQLLYLPMCEGHGRDFTTLTYL